MSYLGVTKSDGVAILASLTQIEKVNRKPVVSRQDVTLLRIQENIRRFNTPTEAHNVSSLAISTNPDREFSASPNANQSYATSYTTMIKNDFSNKFRRRFAPLTSTNFNTTQSIMNASAMSSMMSKDHLNLNETLKQRTNRKVFRLRKIANISF